MLSELRKFRVGMALAHQYLLHQIDPDIRYAVLGSTSTACSTCPLYPTRKVEA